jgi:RNA polymerase sigma factor (TIGR02999 family)
MSPIADLTDTFLRWRRGDQSALAVLVPMLHDEMEAITAAHLRRERAASALQATELAHEACLRLLGQRDITRQHRAHFLSLTAHAMRLVLAEHAHRDREKEGEGRELRVAISDDDIAGSNVIAADDLGGAIEDLGRFEPRQARVVEMRFYAGLSTEETAEALGVSPATVRRDWTVARAWLHRELSGSSS